MGPFTTLTALKSSGRTCLVARSHYTNFTSVRRRHADLQSGPFTVSVTNLLTGTNLLAVEVHQFTTNPIAADMAFGVEVSFRGQYSPPQPAQDSPEAWVEFFNRGQ